MNPNFETIGRETKSKIESFNDKAELTRKLSEYLAGKGIDVNQSRIGHYLRFYDRHLEGKCTDDEVIDEMPHVMREMDEWAWIYQGLKCGEPEGYLEKLKLAIAGPNYASQEINTQARNIQLELRVASNFIQGGFKLNLKGPEDLKVFVGRLPVYVECKRVGSRKQLAKRASEALKQLKRRYSRSRGSRYGLLVLDVSRVLSPHQGLSMSKTISGAGKSIQRELADVANELESRDFFEQDKRLTAIWYQDVSPMIHLDERVPATRFTSRFSLQGGKREKRRQILNELKKGFEAGD